MHDSYCRHIDWVQSDMFTVHPARNFPGMGESSYLTRAFSEQGIRLKIRKDPRSRLRKRGPASDDYSPRHYNKAGRLNKKDESARNEIYQDMQEDSQEPFHTMHSPQESTHQTQSPPPEQPLQTSRGYPQQSSNFFGTESASIGRSDLIRPKTESEQSLVHSLTQNPSFSQPLPFARAPPFVQPLHFAQPPSFAQSHSFVQHHPAADISRYMARKYADTPQSGYEVYSQQQQTYTGYPFFQSPEAVTSREGREEYLASNALGPSQIQWL